MDGFFGIGIQELILIAIVALIVLGPERLPATFREIAKFIRQVRNLTNDFTQQFGDDFKALEDLDPRRMLKQAIDSIDEEEQAKENATKGKTTTPAKTAPAKSTTTSTAGTKTIKSSTTPAKSTPAKSTDVKPVTQPAVNTVPTTTKEAAVAATVDSATELGSAPPDNAAAASIATESAPPTESSTASSLGSEHENRIAPPEANINPQPHAVATNGVGSDDESAPSHETITPPTVATNGIQDHAVNHSA